MRESDAGRKNVNHWSLLTFLAEALAFISVWALMAHAPAFAQTSQGDLTGTVMDSSGGGVPGVKITLTNETTQGRREGATDSVGSYRIIGLNVGSYTIVAEKEGFKKFSQSGILIVTGQVARQDLTLEVGALTQTVEVKDVASTVQAESATITQSLPSVAYGDKPILGVAAHDIFAMDQLMWAPGSANGSIELSYMGNRAAQTQANVEGMQTTVYNVQVVGTSLSTINVVLMNAPAEYARAATVDQTVKSGNNRITGEAMVDMRVPCFNAKNTPFSRPGHIPCNVQKIYNFSAGGPVYLPGVYDGRNKTFFFFNYNSNKPVYNAVGGLVNDPSLEMQAGDFSHYPATIIDPSTGAPFPENKIPDARISAAAKYTFANFMNPQLTYVGPPSSYTQNAFRTGAEYDDVIMYSLRFDQNIKTTDTLSFTWNHSQDSFSNTFAGGDTAYSFANLNIWPAEVASFSETHSFGSNKVNQFRFGMMHLHGSNGPGTGPKGATPLYGKNIVPSMGINGIPLTDLRGVPWIQMIPGPYPRFGPGSAEDDMRWQGYDNFSIVKDRHTIKMGYMGIKSLDDVPYNPGFGYFYFNGMFTGNATADLELGLPSSFSVSLVRPTPQNRRWEHGAFIQDDFKVSKRLTLNYGLRWGKYTTPYDKTGQYYNYDPSTGKIVVPDETALATVNPSWPATPFTIVTAAQDHFPTKLINGTQSWMPRFGFAWRPFGDKTVVRGGWGVYTPLLRFNELQTGGPFTVAQNYTNEQVAVDTAHPQGAKYQFPNPFPSGPVTASVSSITGFNKNLKTPYTQNWNLTLDREIAPNWGLSISYLGTKDTQLPYLIDLNSAVANATPYSASKRPNPALGAINYGANGGNGYYHAARFRVTHQWVRGFWFDGSYSYQDSKTNQYANNYNQLYGEQFSSPEYAYNLARDTGRNPAYATHDFIANSIYDLPFGKGKRWGSGWSSQGLGGKVVNQIAGGWTLTGVHSWRSGLFFTPVLNGFDPGGIGSSSGRRPDKVPGCDPYAGAKNLHGLWFNPSCYTLPAPGELGNVAPNSLEGPGAWITSINPSKEFPLGFREGAKLQIMATIWNIFNHPAYGLPDNSIFVGTADNPQVSPTAGRIFSTGTHRGDHDTTFAGSQRQIRITVKLTF